MEKIYMGAIVFLVVCCGIFFLAVVYEGLFGVGIEYSWSLKWGHEWPN